MTKRRADVMLSINSIDAFIQKLKTSSYQPIVDIIFKYDGCIFGGFLRDFIQDKIPNDMDIVKPCHDIAKFQQWIDEITSLGYTFFENDLEEQIYSGRGLITLHVIEDDDPIENTRLSPCCDPDYDVNFLAIDKKGIFNWVDLSDVMPIIMSIQRNETKPYQPDFVRQEKMKQKGFKILDEEYEYNEFLSTVQTEFMSVSKQFTESKRKIEECTKNIAESKRKIAEFAKESVESNRKIAEFAKESVESNIKIEEFAKQIAKSN